MRSFIIRFVRSVISPVVSFCAIISLSACSTTPPNEHYLDAGARQHIKTVDAVLIAKQDRIGADIKQNSTLTQVSALASSVTFLPMLLEAGLTGVRSVNANKMAKPMREKLEGHDYPSEFRQQVKQSLAGTTLDGVDDFKILRNEYPGLRGQLIASSDADAVLLVDMKYAFTPNFETLYVHSLAMLFPNQPELKQFQEIPDTDKTIEYSDNIYRNQFAVGISTKLKDATTAEYAAEWAEMSEEQLVEVLDAAALIMADTIKNDISIDDLESDLNLIPEGYALNTKYDNLNQSFAKLRSIDSILETPSGESVKTGADPEVDSEAEIESEINDVVVDVKTGS